MAAVSERQRRLFGMALAYKRGEISLYKLKKRYKRVWKDIVDIAKSMSEKEIEKWARKPIKTRKTRRVRR